MDTAESSAFVPKEARQLPKGPKGKQPWLGATVFVAFLQGVFTLWSIYVRSGIAEIEVDYVLVWGSLSLISEAILFFAFGIAVLQRRLWGAYALLCLSSIELIFKFFHGIPPLFSIIFVGICVMGAWSLATSDHLSPTFKTLNWKTIGLFGLLIYGALFLTSFVYGYMGFREVMFTMPTFWLTSFGLMTLLFSQAGIRSRPWDLETTLATGLLVSLISLLIDVPFNKYQGTTWGVALNGWVFGSWLIIGGAILGWGLSSLWRPLSRRPDWTSTNYLARHWRGELSLAKTFWVNYFCINFIFVLVDSWVDFSLGEESPLLSIRTFLVVLLIQIPVWLWQLVGLWRASQNHIGNTGHFFWPRIVQGLVVLFSISNLALVPALIEMGKTAFGLDEIEGYTITLTPDEREVLIDGHIAFGITDKLEKVLSGAPKVWLVHLNSKGGYRQEGRRLHALIKEKHLSTYTQTGCYSACADAFIAGKERILEEGVQLGFHQSSFSGAPYKWLKGEDKKSKQLFLEAEIKEEFVERAFNIPGDDMWFPELQELMDAGVITHTMNDITLTDRRL